MRAFLTAAFLAAATGASASTATPEPAPETAPNLAIVREAPPKLRPVVAKAPEPRMRTVLRCRAGVCVHASTKTAVGSTPPERADAALPESRT